MKHTSSKVMLLVAGALALVYLSLWVSTFLSTFILPRMVAAGSGGIGSVSAGFSVLEPVLAAMLWFTSSFLLWRACANLAAGGDQVMAWHRRFHGWASIVGPLLLLSIVGLGVLGFAVASPKAFDGGWMWFLILAVFGLVVASCGVNVMQLFSVATAFKVLRRATKVP
jgi:hypothetical protein